MRSQTIERNGQELLPKLSRIVLTVKFDSYNHSIAFSVIQKEVFDLLTQKPIILVGHSLENDLSVLKIVPDRVIDTAVRYVHPTPGFKHSLRYLTVHYLNRSIQSASHNQSIHSDSTCVPCGHDPAEDARAALDLTIFYNSCVGIIDDCSF